jgi:hypothetical protein
MAQRNIPDWIEGYLAYTEDSEPPQLFKEWCAVSVIAAALQRKCKLEWGTTVFYPNLYIVLTAPAGKARKGTAMAPARKFIDRIGIPLAAEAVTREALIRTLKESESVLSTETGIIVHSSLTVFSPELTVFLGYNNTQLMSDLTDWFDCSEKWVYRTKTAGTDDISGVFINLLGATTPDLIRSTLPLDAIGGGLTSRMIFVFEEKKGKIVPFPFVSEETRKLETKLYYDIECINMLQGQFKFTKEFLSRWGEWYTAQEGKNPFGANYNKAFDGYIERRPTQVLKLSMVMNASRTDEMVLDEPDLARAIDLLERTEKKMPRAFGGIGMSQNAQLTYAISELIARSPNGVTISDIMRAHTFNGTTSDISDALDILVQSKMIRIDQTNNGPLYRFNN